MNSAQLNCHRSKTPLVLALANHSEPKRTIDLARKRFSFPPFSLASFHCGYVFSAMNALLYDRAMLWFWLTFSIRFFSPMSGCSRSVWVDVLACNLPIQCDTKFTDSNEFEGETKTNRIPATESHQVLVMARTAKESAIERIDGEQRNERFQWRTQGTERTCYVWKCLFICLESARGRYRGIERNR